MEDSGNDSVAVSIPERNILEGDSAKANGGHIYRSLSTKWAALTEEVITMLEKRVQVVKPPEPAFFSTWDHVIFTRVCAIAVLIDPLFLYMNIVNDNMKCLDWDHNLTTTYMVLRSTIDLFYVVNLVFYIWRNNKKLITWRRKSDQTACAGGGRKENMLFPVNFFLLFVVVLPIPQVLLLLLTWIIVKWIQAMRYITGPQPLLILFQMQYWVRVYLIYINLKQRPNTESGIGRWLQPILDCFPFILTAHLYGALWYSFAIERQLKCWTHACSNVKGCDLEPIYCRNGVDDSRFIKPNMTAINLINKLCPIDLPNATIFDFGIYLYAIQSGMTRSENIIPKMLQGFWWGLQNLSSFGSNLQTSFHYSGEIIFATSLSISGILLFLIYLNERMQEAKRRSKELKLTRKMQTINPEIDLWLSKNGLPNDKDIKKWIRKSVRQKLEQDKDVVQNLNILSVLPIILRRDIMSSLRLASLKKVPMLEKMNERVLKAICNHLEPMTYTKNSYIIRDGEPLWSMLFITQGTALTYRTSSNSNVNNMGVSTSDSSICDCLQKGDFYGEELLNWAFTFASFSELPISTRNIISQTKLEAFSINASDLKSVVSRFQFYFSLMNHPHLERSHLAASFLQLAWGTGGDRKISGNNLSKLVKSD